MFVLAAVGCSTWSVQSSYDRSAVSGPYRTYAFAARAASPEQQQLEQEVERQLVAKGMIRVEQQPDVLVSYDLVQLRTANITRPGTFNGLGRSFGEMGSPRPSAFGQVERTLVIRFDDARTRQAFWTGTATQPVTSQPSPPEMTAAADEILRRFPTQTVAAR